MIIREDAKSSLHYLTYNFEKGQNTLFITYVILKVSAAQKRLMPFFDLLYIFILTYRHKIRKLSVKRGIGIRTI